MKKVLAVLTVIVGIVTVGVLGIPGAWGQAPPQLSYKVEEVGSQPDEIQCVLNQRAAERAASRANETEIRRLGVLIARPARSTQGVYRGR